MLTPAFTAGPEQFFHQIESITKSHSLRGSDSLSRLLQYLAKQSIDHPDAPLKEYQIATEVYGRPESFDPQSDSTVRVQASRLRVKLAEYYAREGAADPILVKIPKGSYHLVFEAKPVELPPQPQAVPSAQPPSPTQPLPSGVAVETVSRMGIAVIFLSIGLMTALLVLGAVLWNRKPSESTTARFSARNAPPSLVAFWKPFTAGVEEPWVIFSNAAFVGRPETGMRYYNSRQDANSAVYDHYTGVGEVLAIHALDDAFATLGRRILVKRGSLFTLDDVKNNNLIFVGSPSENLSLRDIPGTDEFVFQRVPSGPREGDLSIVNKHPRPGEASSYLASPSAAPLTEDYSVVGLVPGIESGRYVIILAGTTTFGTQGAVEFVCDQAAVEKLLREIPGSSAGIRPFEALVRVKIARGVPVETELVSVRVR